MTLENELLATGVHRISMFLVPMPFLKSLYNFWSQNQNLTNGCASPSSQTSLILITLTDSFL